MLENLHLETFSEHLNSNFSVGRGEAVATELQLIEAHNVGKAAPGYEQFSLLFRGPLDSFLEQTIYTFKHDALGTFDMFIVPVQKNQDGFIYESIINRPL
ncbi:MAG TPA: hypothetical protein VF735_00555 [Pyrinomonadaceae bacterium]|jgi:hypothetical protein